MTSFYTAVSRQGSYLLYRGYENGQRIQNKIYHKPHIYLKDNDAKSDVKDLFGVPVVRRDFENMYAVKDFFEKYDSVMKFYGTDDWIAQYIYEKFPQAKIPYNPADISVAYVDIEVNTRGQGFPEPADALFAIDAITVKSSKMKQFHVFTLHDWDPAKSALDPEYIDKIVHHKCPNENQLLVEFMMYWNRIDPDVITGWNIDGFDIPYIFNRCTKAISAEFASKLSPWGRVNAKTVKDHFGRESIEMDIQGVATIDYQDVFKKFAHSYPKQEKYSLDHIANLVLGEKKLDYSEYGNITTLADNNPQLYVDYNIKDVILVERMEQKVALLALIFTMSYEIGCNYKDVFGTVKQWEITLYRYMARLGIILQPRPPQSSQDYEGAYVNPSAKGMFNWVMSVDLASLYPNIAIQWNMGPETLMPNRIEGITPDVLLKQRKVPDLLEGAKYDYTIAANGYCFSTTKQSIIGRILSEIYAARKTAKIYMLEAKRKYKETGDIKWEIERIQWNNAQMSAKLRLNSWYGAMANKYFRHFDVRIAEAITLTGQLANMSGQRDINSFMNKVNETTGKNYILAGDTDSTYFHVEGVVKNLRMDTAEKVDFLDRFGDECITPIIRNAYDEIFNYCHCYENRLDAVRDIIADRAVWTGVKKRYIMHVWDAEKVRFTEPEIKMTGVEAIRSSTPAVLKKWMKEIFKLVMTSDEKTTEARMTEMRKEWDTLLPEDIAFPKSSNNMDNYCNRSGKWQIRDTEKGIPIGVRAAHNYNCLLRQFNVENRYPTIRSGDKIKYLFLRLPNIVDQNVVGFVDKFPDEFGMAKYIDRQTQWQKGLIDPLEDILQACGYNTSDSISLDDLFRDQ